MHPVAANVVRTDLARHVSHTARAREKIFARAERDLDVHVLHMTIVDPKKPPRPAMAGATREAISATHSVASRGGFFALRYSTALTHLKEVRCGQQ
jgi:hypothetical protein